MLLVGLLSLLLNQSMVASNDKNPFITDNSSISSLNSVYPPIDNFAAIPEWTVILINHQLTNEKEQLNFVKIPYKKYISSAEHKITNSFKSSIKNYSTWGIFTIIFMMWLLQSISLIREE